ncbi:MAG TPA: [FeFe] hydrogenase H-cluster radical SAM maturase HydE, partial [Spirochaetia bacterium]|nr:[FeFe] hydrogenase H-cluster radical SAM maturase HydE [Spirochaetia bacterium]
MRLDPSLVSEVVHFYRNAGTPELMRRANAVCKETYGTDVYLRGLLEFTNHCALDCQFCGIRRSNAGATRY